MIQVGSPFFLRMSKRRIWLTVSKAPEMSIESSIATCFLEVQIVYICSVKSSNAVSVERPFLPPICISGRRWYSSAMALRRLAISASMTFLIVLIRAIGLHAPRSVYVGFLGFLSTMVRASLNC